MRVRHTRCDVCGVVTDEKGYWPVTHQEGNDSYRAEMVIRYIAKEDEEEQDYKQSYDVCPLCWFKKVIPFMDSIGAKLQTCDY